VQTIIRGVPTITDRDLERIGHANPGYKIERDDDGSLVVSPTNTDGHYKEAEAFHQLRAYQALAGGRAGGASGGFTNPRGGVKSPDASWISDASIAQLTEEQKRETFVRVTPDVTIEIASPSDVWGDVVAKAEQFFKDGARYSVALNPSTRDIVTFGTPPPNLELDFDAIMDAKL
jgi:Uma2 family endonuclease